jgi:hypothetical protein
MANARRWPLRLERPVRPVAQAVRHDAAAHEEGTIMSRTGDEITELSPDMLAQARGCDPENECYADCCDAARSAIDGDYLNMMSDQEKQERETELGEALAWARKQRWVP